MNIKEIITYVVFDLFIFIDILNDFSVLIIIMGQRSYVGRTY